MEKTIGNATVKVNEEGYMTDFSQWNQTIGTALAEEKGIAMTDQHWEVVSYLQDKYQKEEPLSIRGIKKSGVIDVKSFYNLFPGGPLKVSTLIAGIPKPKSCI